MQLPVTIVVPYYNTPESLNHFLKNLEASFPIIIIDNASTKRIESTYGAEVIKLPFNSGFSHACNLGTLYAETEWVLFANSDIQLDPKALESLYAYAQENNLDCVSPVLVNERNEVSWNYHQSLPTPFSIFTQFSPLKSIFKYRSLKNTTLPGACLLIKKSVLEKLQGWDERLFLWWEDSDLSMKLQENGISFAIAETINVKHQGGESFKPLDADYKRAIFFHSLEQMSKSHFVRFLHELLSSYLHRFYTNKLYPPDSKVLASVVVPNMKKELLVEFFLNNAKFFEFEKHELIIVTSATELSDLRKKYPAVIFIQIKNNQGFAATVNIGFNRARGQYIATVNDDTILERNWLEKLISEFDENTGSVSPQIVKIDGSVESLGIHLEPKGKAIRLLKSQSKYSINAFNAAAVILSRNALETVGLFSENFGSYLEDLDLGLRMYKLGFSHKAVATVTITHLGQQTSKQQPLKKAWQDVKNWWLLILQNYSFEDYLAAGFELFVESGRNLSGLLKSFKNAK